MESLDIWRMEMLVETVQKLSLAKDIQSVMEIVRTVARNVTGADGATFVLKDHDMCYYAEEDAISPLWKGSRFPMKICISGWAMINKKPAVIKDIYQDDRIPIDAYKPTFVKSLITVPIRVIDPLGAIGNYWADIHDPTHEEVSILQALADITAVSIENIYFRNELEEKITERNTMLEQLKNQNEKLEEFNQIISHNLRAPLSNMLILNDMVEESEEIEEKLLYIDKLKLVIKHFSNTFEELTEASRVKMDFSIKSDYIELQDFIESSIELLSGDIQKKEADITFDISELKTINYPKEYLNSIFQNLIENALKYSSPNRKPKLHIKSFKKDGWSSLIFQDNGIGIDLTKHKDDMFKLHKVFHNHPDAHGFGLYIIKTQIEAMGGNISLESIPEQGTTFQIQLIKDKN